MKTPKTMPERARNIDSLIIDRLRRIAVPMARIAIFIVYFWFGLLKILGVSPAGPLVHALFQQTLTFLSFPVFYMGFAVFEMSIGIVFLIRGCERAALPMLAIHLVMTALPLVLLPAMAWQAPLIPTLEGQYIIKNILIAALAVVIGAQVKPLARP